MRSRRACGVALGVLGLACTPAEAQTAVATGTSATTTASTVPLVTEVRIEQEGQAVTDAAVVGLIETKIGEPFSPGLVRDSISHLISLNRFEDVQVFRQPASGGVAVRYALLPLHPVDRVEFQGDLGLPEGDLRRVVTDAFGDPPRAAQAAGVVATLRRSYQTRGYPAAEVTSAIQETHNPDRASLVVSVQAGPPALVEDVRIEYAASADAEGVTDRPNVRRGERYDRASIERELQRWTGRVRERGHYEARASHGVSFPPGGGAFVSVSLSRGPLVAVAFTGDPLSRAEQERLVPVRAEASADEDLLEDSNRSIQDFLRERGYRDASVLYTRDERDDRLTVTFAVTRGARFTVSDVQITGQGALSTAELRALLRVQPGDPFVQSALETGIGAILEAYRVRGYVAAQVQRQMVDLAPESPADRASRVAVALGIVEGPRTLVRNVELVGASAIDADLRALLVVQPGQPFSESDVTVDRDRLELEYRNRGYDRVVVATTATRVDEGRGADVRFAITEGVPVIVDRVIISGHRRTSPATIERELLVRPGDPMSLSRIAESRARLAALGLFRRPPEIQEIRHGNEPRVDLIVRVEEAPPMTVGAGGGLEFSSFARATGESGQAEDRYELAPRGLFEVGRRNLWGTSRAVNLFTRVSLRSRDVVVAPDGVRLEDPERRGFTEYRVVGTFREPRVAGSSADVLVTGILEQAKRSSFNFLRREARAEAAVSLSSTYSVSARYSFERTELFDEKLTPDELPLIDRLFPQVRLSTVTAALVRETRDDPLDASRGTFFLVESALAARAIGSEVGFARTFLQGSAYYRVPLARRTVFAANARLGAAQGFPREVTRVDASGHPVVEVVEDLPASRRFFAGGETTVRGFSLDRLGDDATISASGFPTGGNGLIVLNGELRVAAFGPVQAVGFLDAGNVVRRAGDLRLTRLRAATGFGVRVGTPFGPIRLDWGFKLDRRELSPGRLERASRIHVSLGQAF
jgi:outer membrane protein insertion porin family